MSPTPLTEKLIPLHAAGDEDSMAEAARLQREAAKPKSKPRAKSAAKRKAPAKGK